MRVGVVLGFVPPQPEDFGADRLEVSAIAAELEHRLLAELLFSQAISSVDRVSMP